MKRIVAELGPVNPRWVDQVVALTMHKPDLEITLFEGLDGRHYLLLPEGAEIGDTFEYQPTEYATHVTVDGWPLSFDEGILEEIEYA